MPYQMAFMINGKESTCNAGDLDLIPGLGKSPGEEKGYPLQYSGLENSMDCIVQEDAELTHLSNFHFHFHLGYGVKCIQVHNFYFFIILCSLFIYILAHFP